MPLPFYIICVGNLHCASLGRRGEGSSYILLTFTTLLKPFNCRHLPCYLVPDQGIAEGDTLESSATYTELQWVGLQETRKQPKLAGNWIHAHGFVPAGSNLQRKAPLMKHSGGFCWAQGVRVPKILQDIKQCLDTIKLHLVSLLPKTLWDYLGAGAAAQLVGGLYITAATGHLNACDHHWLYNRYNILQYLLYYTHLAPQLYKIRIYIICSYTTIILTERK